MKSKFTFLLIAGALAVLTIGCSKTQQYDALPHDAIMAAKVNVNQLLNKSEVLQDTQVKGVLKDGIGDLSKETRDIFKQMMEQPDACGIDFDEPVILACTNVENDEFLVTMVVKNKENLTSFFKTMIEEERFDLEDFDLREKDDYTVIEGRRTSYIAFDNKKCVIVCSDDMDAADYMNLTKTNRATNDARFKDFCKSKDDIAIYVDYEQMVRLASLIEPSLDLDDLEDMYEDVYSLLTLHFEDGKAVVTMHVDGNENFVKQCKANFRDPSRDNLAFVPQNAWAVFNAAMPNLGDIYSELPSSSRRVVDDALNELGISSYYLNDFSGDITFAILPIQQMGDEQLPQMMGLVKCDSKRWIEWLAKNVNDEWEEVDRNVYAMNLNSYTTYDYSNPYYDYDWEIWTYPRSIKKEGYDYFVGYTDGYLFVMPENIYNKCVKNGNFVALGNNFTSNAMADKLQKAGVVYDLTQTLKDVRSSKEIADDPDFVLASKYLKQIKGFTFEVTDPQTVQGTLIMNETDKNALNVISDALIGAAVKGDLDI